MEITVESIRDQIPYYLPQESKENLVKALKAFPDVSYYINRREDEILQGDVWTSLDVFNFCSGEKKPIKGIILSNSCDISLENKRVLSTKVSFAPIVRLDNYINLLKKRGLDNDVIKTKITAIKRQQTTNRFYLPKGDKLEADFVALLDDLHSVPLRSFIEKVEKCKLCTLNQVSFYLFLMKLSIHFCRFHEGLDRDGCQRKDETHC